MTILKRIGDFVDGLTRREATDRLADESGGWACEVCHDTGWTRCACAGSGMCNCENYGEKRCPNGCEES